MQKMANGLIKVSSYLYDREESYSFNLETPWLMELFQEVESEQILSSEKTKSKGHLNLDFTLKKVKGLEFGDYFILKGTLSTLYNCSCVRCLELTQKNLELELSCCFLSSDQEESDLIDDNGKVLIENEEMDAFFYKNGYLDLKEFMHEYLFMNLDPLPLHIENCRGLCSECGTNLNVSTCPHISR
jgi:uncharacterized protein